MPILVITSVKTLIAKRSVDLLFLVLSAHNHSKTYNLSITFGQAWLSDLAFWAFYHVLGMLHCRVHLLFIPF